MATTAALNFAQGLYVGYYARPADVGGLKYWADRFDSISSNSAAVKSLTVEFGNGAEADNLYQGMTIEQRINAVYLNVLGRGVDADGLDYWRGLIANKTVSLSELASAAVQGALHATDPKDLAAINNKLAAASAFTAKMTVDAQLQVAYSGPTAAAVAIEYMKGVVDAATELNAENGLANTFSTIAQGSNAGKTFTLTTGVDNLVGTAGDDTFNAQLTPGTTPATSTLTIGDTIDGKGGNNTLKAIIDTTGGAASLPAGVSISNIASLNVVANTVGASAISLDASKIGGLTAATVTSTGTAGVTLDNLGKAVAVTLAGQNANATTLNYNGAAATDSVNLVLNGTYGASATANATVTLGKGTTAAAADVVPTAVAITGTGGKVELVDSSITKVTANVSGASTIALNNAAVVKTVDLTGSAGKVTVDLFDKGGNAHAGSATAAFSFTGGSAADTLKLAITDLANYGSTWSIKGDTTNSSVLNVVNVAAVVPGSASAVATPTGNTLAAINAITGFKTLDITQFDSSAAGAVPGTVLTEGAISLDVSKITSVTDFKFDGALLNSTNNVLNLGGIAITGEGNANTFTVANNVKPVDAATGADAISIAPLVDNSANVATFTLTSTSGLNVTGGNATGAGNNGGHAINAAVGTNSIETVNLVSTGTGAEPGGTSYYNVLAGGNGNGAGVAGSGVNLAVNGKLVVTGDHSIDVGIINGNAQTIDASGLSANFKVVQLGTANDSFLGGAGSNNITLSGGVDTVDLSKSVAKADVINMNTFSATGQTTANLATSITGFTNAVTTGDKLDVVGAATVVTTGTTNYVNGTISLTALVGGQGNVAFSGVTGAATLTDYATAAGKAAAFGAANAGATVEFQFGNDTYVLSHVGVGTTGYAAGTDALVKLVGVTGVTGLSTTASDASHIFIA